MTKFLFWQRWLFVVSIIICIAGVVIVLLSGTLIFDVFNQLINPVFWGSTSVGDNAKGFQQFVYAILGAIMASWGLFMVFIAHYPFRNKEKWAWRCIVAGIVLWFVLDTFFSIYYQVYVNAIANTGLLILVMLPVFFTRKDFVQ